MSASGGTLVTTLYRELLRSCRRTKAVMRPGHVVLVGECVQRFAARSPALQLSVQEHGPLLSAAIVRSSFRMSEPEGCPREIDDAFSALRMLHSVEEWVGESACPLSLFAHEPDAPAYLPPNVCR